MISEINLLRVFAIVLIVHSQAHGLYPDPKWCFGNHLGNSLFYLISGYGLSISYKKNPLPSWLWLIRRIINIFIPLILVVFLLSLGNIHEAYKMFVNYTVWNNVDGFIHFLPVLWLLYLLFIPLGRLDTKNLLRFFGAVMIASFGLFLWRLYSGVSYGTGMPAKQEFFIMSAIGCFSAGIIMSRMEISAAKYGTYSRRLILLSLVLGSQILHRIIINFFPGLALFNFYLNYVSVISIVLFVFSVKIKYPENFRNVLRGMAMASLAVYLVHFKLMALAQHLELLFPYNIIFVMAHSLIWSYGITHITAKTAEFLYSKTKQFLRSANKPVLDKAISTHQEAA